MHLLRLLLAVFSLVALAAGCPPSTRACDNSDGCRAGEICLDGTCHADGVPSDAGVAVVDSGAPIDSGTPDGGGEGEGEGEGSDAGPDGGPSTRSLRGAVDVAAATLRSGTRTLRGHVNGVGPTTLRGDTHRLSRSR